MIGRVGAVLGALLLSGCVQLGGEAAKAGRLYPLEAAYGAARMDVAHAPVVAVAEPTGPALAMGRQIVWRRDDVLGVMQDSAWTDTASLALQRVFVHTAAQSGDLTAIRIGTSARANYILRVDVVAFEIEEQGAAVRARFTAQAVLIDAGSRSVVFARYIDKVQPVSARRSGLAALALQQAAQEAAQDVAAWIGEIPYRSQAR